MRRHITTLVLTTSTLVLTDATQLRTPTVDEDSTLLRREADLTPGLKNLERRTWVSRPHLELEYVKRHSDRNSKNGDGGQHGDHPGDEGGDDQHGDTGDGGEDEDDEEGDDDASSTPPAQTPTSTRPPMPTTPLTTSIPQGDPYLITTPISGITLPASSSVVSISFTPSPTPIGTPTGSTSSSSFLSSTSTTNTTPLSSSSPSPSLSSPSPSPPSPSPSLSNTNQSGNIGNSDNDNDDGPSQSTSEEPHDNNSDSAKIAGGVVGGLLLLLLLLFLWYWLVMRPKRRERLKGGENTALANDTDLESHVTVDLRNGPHASPLDGRSSSGGDGPSSSSGNAMSSVPIPAPFAIAAAHHLSTVPASSSPSPYQAHAAEPYSASQRSPEASSPATSHHSFMDGYEAVYGQAHPLAYSPLGNSQGNSMSMSALPLSRGVAHDRPSPLEISKHPDPAMELDGRPPPPRYPDAIAATSPPHPNSGPTSPLPVSPLSVISPTLLMSESHFRHPQQGAGPGPRQPSYEAYEASTLPEVVSPMYQLGQVSASPPEYDESAETAQQNNNNNNNNNHNHNDDDFAHHGDEKQALSQQPMPRY